MLMDDGQKRIDLNVPLQKVGVFSAWAASAHDWG